MEVTDSNPFVIFLSSQLWIINTSEILHENISVSVLFHFVQNHDSHKTLFHKTFGFPLR